jgi:beta-barrel assembly-enhancing protease
VVIFILLPLAHGQLTINRDAAFGKRRSSLPPDSSMASVCSQTARFAAFTSESNIDLRRQGEEWALGHELAVDVEQHISMIADPTITRYLNGLEQKIVRKSGLGGCFVVKLIDDPEPNAYSLPGGFLYLTTGLMRSAESEGELAAALAHETGHVTARHFSNIDSRRRMWGRLALGGGPVGYAFRRYIGPLLTLKLLRDAEFEADQLGLQYYVASGYDPDEFIELLQVVFQGDDKPGLFFERLYDTHPLTRSRTKRLEKASRRFLMPQMGYIVNTSEFLQVKIRLATIKARTN